MTAKKRSNKTASNDKTPEAETPAVEEKGLTIFQEYQVPDVVANKLLDLFPDFHDMPQQEQVDLIQFIAEQAVITTQQVKSRFPMISVKHAGVNKIEIPAPIGEEENPLVTAIEGVMVYQYLTKAYWKAEMSEGGGGAPDCASLDGLTPYTKDPQAEKCFNCPLNKFGTRQKGRGKACRDIKRVILLMEGHELPLRLSISSSNIRSLDQYLNDVRDRGMPIGTMLTRVKAVGAENADGVKFTGIEFSTIRQLKADEIRDVMAAKRAYQEDFRIGSIESNEGGDSEAPDPNARSEQAKSAKAADVM